MGRHSTSLERSGLPPQSKEGQLGLLFLRVMRSLDALMGSDPELMRHWLEQPNHHLWGAWWCASPTARDTRPVNAGLIRCRIRPDWRP